MNVGAGRKPKVNLYWSRMFAAKRRAIDLALLEELERTLPEVVDKPSLDKFVAHMDEWVDNDIKAAIAKAFGRPPP